MSELKPCPFCGKKVVRQKGYMGLNFFKCKNCGAVISFNNDFCNNNPDKAINAWNRRAEDGKKKKEIQ